MNPAPVTVSTALTPEAVANLRRIGDQLDQAMQRIAQGLREAFPPDVLARFRSMASSDTLARLRRVSEDPSAREVRLAGQQARFYVRAGLDPAYATEAARDALVHHVLTSSEFVGMDAAERSALGAAVIRGWLARP